MITSLIGSLVRIQNLFQNQEGQDLVEYAMVIALIAFGATVALQALGTGLYAAFIAINSTLGSSLT